ncbi:MAG: hypothetical protein R3D05_02420 [Dongiaceae bacterium]
MDAGQLLARRAITALLLALGAAACSTADYSKPVNDFAAATGNAKSALTDLNAEVTAAYRVYLDKSIAKGDLLLTHESNDCEVESDRCRLIVLDKNGENAGDYPPEPPLTRMTLLMGEIDGYAANLKALLEDNTAQQVEADVNAALGSIQHLATTVSELQTPPGAAPADIPQFATPVGEGVNWVLGQYIERVKFKGLQRATAEAKPVIRRAADLFDIASSVAAAPRVEMANEVAAAQDAAQTSRDRTGNDAYAKAAAKFDALLAEGPPEMFQRMAAAHDALAESLQGEHMSLATVNARIQDFAAQAEQLAKILRDLRALAAQQ